MDSNLNSIVFLDVETPNRFNDSICAIGAYRISSTGAVEHQLYHLVDPECSFTFDNIAIHKITPADVAGCPNFAELWDAELFETLDNALLVAHGVVFDLTALARCLKRYRKKFHKVKFADTREMAHRYLPGLSDYSISGISAEMGFSNPNHHARRDAENCMRAFYVFADEYGMNIEDPDIWHVFDFDSIIKEDMSKSHIGQPRNNMVDKLPAIVERNAANVELDGAVVCLTGDFEMSPDTPEPVIAYIEQKGATLSRNLTLSVDYLVVGNLGSPRWKHGNYGNKIAKAMEWIADHKSNIRIIDENSITAGDFIF